MERDEFNLVVETAKRKNPIWFELSGDPPASSDEVSNAEALLGVRFPESYRSFLQEYGGGYFAFVTVFSAGAGSEWSVVDRNRDAQFIGGEFLAISDNGAGDFYGFRVVNGECQPSIVFWDHEENGRISATPFRDLYEFLVEVGLRTR